MVSGSALTDIEISQPPLAAQRAAPKRFHGKLQPPLPSQNWVHEQLRIDYFQSDGGGLFR